MLNLFLKKILYIVIIVLLFAGILEMPIFAVETSPVYKTFYVDSVNGNDAGTGTQTVPFQSIERAQEAVRGVNKNMKGDIYVYLKGGEYNLSKPIEMTGMDSASNGYKIVYTAVENEKPEITGGTKITDWNLYDKSKNIYRASSKRIDTRQLYVNGQRAVRARSDGGLTNGEKTETGFICDNQEMVSWRNIQDVEFVYYVHWTQPRNHPEAVTKKGDKAIIKMLEPGWTYTTDKGMTSAKLPVYIENAFELLDKPGEWYLDKKENMIYYIPLNGQDMSLAEVVAPVLEKLVEIKGDSIYTPVKNIHFNGISFRYTTWLLPSTEFGMPDAQNNYIRQKGYGDRLAPGAIVVRKGDGINFYNCDFSALGINGLQYLDFSKNFEIMGNRFYDIDGNGLNVGEITLQWGADATPYDDKYVMENIIVSNNVIHDIGVTYGASSGLSTGYPRKITIENNEIYNVPYCGMHIGYGWRSVPKTVITDTVIRNNYVHDTCMRLYDGGGVYTNGTTGGTVENPNKVINNYFTNHWNSWGPIYHDEGSNYWRDENNVVDLIDVPDWPGYGANKKLWANVTRGGIIYFEHNYTTEKRIQYPDLLDFPEYVKDTFWYPTRNWNQEAINIINAAGLTAPYSYLGDTKPLYMVDLDMQKGEKKEMDILSVLSKWLGYDARQECLDLICENDSVAKISKNSLVTALSRGSTIIKGSYNDGKVKKNIEIKVFVDDMPGDVSIFTLDPTVNDIQKMSVDKTVQAGFYTETKLKRILPFDIEKTWSDDKNIADINRDGVIAYKNEGKTKIHVAGTFEGTKVEGEFPVMVIGHGSFKEYDREKYTTYKVDQDVLNPDNWLVDGSGSAVNEDGNIILQTPAVAGKGFATYKSRKFGSEIIEMNLKIDAPDDSWPLLSIRNPSATDSPYADPNGSGYLLVIKKDVIELQRYNKNQRTVIFGSFLENIIEKAIDNKYIEYAKTHNVRYGAINEEDGVRIIFDIDNKNIINYLDTDGQRLSEDGYFGVIARTGNITIGEGK